MGNTNNTHTLIHTQKMILQVLSTWHANILRTEVVLLYSWCPLSLPSHLLSSEYLERHFNQDGEPSQSVVRLAALGGLMGY